MADKSRRDLPPLACVIDGETDTRVLELHRIGDAHVMLCRNCYVRLLDVLRTKPTRIWEPPDELEKIGQALIAEADLFTRLAASHREFGQLLIDRVRRESPNDPDNRT